MSFDEKLKENARLYSNFLIHNRYGSFGALFEPERQMNLSTLVLKCRLKSTSAWSMIVKYTPPPLKHDHPMY